MEENTNVFTPEQREAIKKALKEPEARKAIIAILEEAGLLHESRDQLSQ